MALHGIAFASVHTAAFTYAVKAISLSHRGQSLGYFTLGTFLAMAVAAPFGLFLVSRYSFTVFFLTFASLCVCSFLLSWGPKEAKTVNSPDGNFPPRAAALVEWKIIVPSIAAFLQMFVYGAIAAFFPSMHSSAE